MKMMVKRAGMLAMMLSLVSLTVAQGAARIPERQVDVLVIGGTTSGTSAGLAAARGGARTLIVEETPWLGGMLTAQGVGATDGNFELPSGIWNEFREHLRARYGGQAKLWTGWVSTTLFEPHVGDSIFKAMAAQEKQLEVVYGYHVTDVLKKGGRVVGATFADCRGGRMTVRAKVTVDATDLGDALPFAGAAYRVGLDARGETGEALAREMAEDIVQDLTWVAILKDYGEGADKTILRPEGYDPAEFEGCCTETVDGIHIDCRYMMDYGKMPGGKYMLNWPLKGNDIYLNVVEMPRKQRNCELQKAKDKTLRFVYHIQHTLGFKHLGLADDEFDTPDKLAYLPYHREGRRLQGIVQLTLDDVTDRYGRPAPLYRTGISVGDYPVDHHHNCYPGFGRIPFPPVPSFSIPLGTLIPAQTDGLIVSDKAISVSNLINGSTRLQPVVLLTGQAAGTLAALSVKKKCQPRQVPVRDVQAALLAQKAYLMPLYDVKPADPDFGAIQRIACTGILETVGEPFQWANRTWFYPDSTITVAEFTRGLHGYAPSVAAEAGTELLTAGRAVGLIRAAAGEPAVGPEAVDAEAAALGIVADEPVVRRDLARMLDVMLNPFARPVGFDGNYKKR